MLSNSSPISRFCTRLFFLTVLAGLAPSAHALTYLLGPGGAPCDYGTTGKAAEPALLPRSAGMTCQQTDQKPVSYGALFIATAFLFYTGLTSDAA